MTMPQDHAPSPVPSAQAQPAAAADLVLDRSRPGVALLRLARPSRLNALTQDTVRALCAALDAVAADASVRVVILTGEGRGFCAGWDLASPLAADASVTELVRGQELFAGMIKRLRALDAVVIAAVNGPAVGAGFALALAADLRLAARSAAFHVGAVKIGLTAGECGISYHLPRLVGASRAFEAMLTGRPIEAAEADRIGLVSAVVDDAQLAERALAMAEQLLRLSPYATRHTKRLMYANLEAPSLDAAIELENRAQVMALLTEDFREAAAAFVAKRPPVFTGR